MCFQTCNYPSCFWKKDKSGASKKSNKQKLRKGYMQHSQNKNQGLRPTTKQHRAAAHVKE
jgi:hypothetical protein